MPRRTEVNRSGNPRLSGRALHVRSTQPAADSRSLRGGGGTQTFFLAPPRRPDVRRRDHCKLAPRKSRLDGIRRLCGRLWFARCAVAKRTSRRSRPSRHSSRPRPTSRLEGRRTAGPRLRWPTQRSALEQELTEPDRRYSIGEATLPSAERSSRLLSACYQNGAGESPCCGCSRSGAVGACFRVPQPYGKSRFGCRFQAGSGPSLSAPRSKATERRTRPPLLASPLVALAAAQTPSAPFPRANQGGL